MHQDATLATEVGLAQATLCYMGAQLPLPHGKGHNTAHFLAHVYCGQTVAYLSNCCAVVIVMLLLTFFSGNELYDDDKWPSAGGSDIILPLSGRYDRLLKARVLRKCQQLNQGRPITSLHLVRFRPSGDKTNVSDEEN